MDPIHTFNTYKQLQKDERSVLNGSYAANLDKTEGSLKGNCESTMSCYANKKSSKDTLTSKILTFVY